MLLTGDDVCSKVETDIDSIGEIPAANKQRLESVLWTIACRWETIVASLHVRYGVSGLNGRNEGLIHGEIVRSCFIEPNAHECARWGVRDGWAE
jgi:hypothetical protein